MEVSPLLDSLGGLSALLLVAALGALSYRLAWRLVPGVGVATRWSAAAVIALWSAVASFWLLGAVHAFRLPIVLVLSVGAALLGGRGRGGDRPALTAFRADLRRFGAFFRSLGPLEWAALAAVLGVVLARCLRGLASPPLGWDSLTYHLFKAGRFVQTGGFVDAPAPDAWGAYRFFPVAGEILWSWAMLPLHDDALIAPAGLLIWGLAVLGVYAAARELGARARPALLAALALGAMPAALAYVGSAYVDNLTLAASALGTVFVVRLARDGPLREAPLAVAALALAAGTKLLAMPVLALGGAVVLLRLVRSPASPRVRAATLAAVVLAGAVAAPTYVRTWIERGSPLYPVPLRVAGFELSAGNAESAAVTQRILDTPRMRLSPAATARYFLVRRDPSGAFLNPGPGAVLLLGLALAALPRLRRDRLLAGTFLWLVAAVLLGAYVTGAMALFRTALMVTTSGRYLTPAFAALAVLAALLDWLAARLVAAVAAGWGAVLAFPTGWHAVDLRATAWVLVPMGALAAVILAARWAVGAGRARRLAATAAVLLVTGVAAASLETVRRAFRYPVYAAAAEAEHPSFTLHPLDRRYASAWPVWQAFDGGRSWRLAAVAGFDGLGHNAYLYPLLGSRLQNRVSYVPVTGSGEVIDYRLTDRVTRRASRGCWLERLRRQEIDGVVLLAPRHIPESRWVEESPELFRLRVETDGGRHAAYELDRDLLAERTAGTPCPGVGGAGRRPPRDGISFSARRPTSGPSAGVDRARVVGRLRTGRRDEP